MKRLSLAFALVLSPLTVSAAANDPRVIECSPPAAGLKTDITIVAQDTAAWYKTLVSQGVLKNPHAAQDFGGTNRVPDPARDGAYFSPENAAWKAAVAQWDQSLFPVIQDRALADLKIITPVEPLESSGSEPEKKRFKFKLEKTEKNRPKWLELLGGTGMKDRPVTLTLGIATTDGGIRTMPSAVGGPDGTSRFSLVTASRLALGMSVLMVIVLGIAFILLAVKSNLLRDTTMPLNPGGRFPFSLGRCQIAWWTAIIGISFLVLWVVLGEYDTITESELVLLGISAATGLGAIFVNNAADAQPPASVSNEDLPDKRPEAVARALADARATWQRAAAVAEAKRAEVAATTDTAAAAILQAQLDALKTEAEKMRLKAWRIGEYVNYRKSGGAFVHFFLDLLRERDAVSFHRFQLVAWSLVLGAIFIVTVIRELRMPAFGATLLTLMGISNGTYLGFKWPEAKRP